MEKKSEWQERVAQFKKAKKCIYPVREYSHRVACNKTATDKSPDGLPVCSKHTDYPVRDGWRGFIKGA